MASILPGYEYDIFISYRQKDNKGDHWVTEFVNALKTELESAFKEDISIYFDSNPHDGLLETHNVDKSLEGKLKCLIFIPILSQTYCDPKSFAWRDEFCAFNKWAQANSFGRDIKLKNGNVASRILPVQIHELEAEDKALIEIEIGGVLRSVEFIYQTSGVVRPLLPNEEDARGNLKHTFYRDQMNKVVRGIKELISGMQGSKDVVPQRVIQHAEGIPVSARKKLSLAATVVLAMGLVGYALFYFTGFGATLFRERDRSIAVLPFDNMNRDSTQDYFSSGIAEDILNHLVKISDLKVKSRTSTLQYKGTTKTVSEIGDELNVTNVVEGSVRRVGEKVRIVVQLIDVNTDTHLWSETYDRDLKDVLALQSEIAIEIARALQVKLSPTEQQSIENEKSQNVTAYDYFLKAREFRRRGSFKRNDIENAILLTNQAIQIDNGFARAYALKATLWFDMTNFGVPENVWRDSVIHNANRAMEIDPRAPDSYLIKSIVYRFLGNIKKADEEVRSAFKVAPNNPEVLQLYGYLLLGEKKEEGADMILKSAEDQFSPKDPEYYNSLVNAYFFTNNSAMSLQLLTQSKNLNPDAVEPYLNLSATYRRLGQYDKAIDEAKKAFKINADLPFVTDQLAWNYFRKKDYENAAKCWSRYPEFEVKLSDSSQTIPFRHRLAMVYSKLGRKKEGDKLVREDLKIQNELLNKKRGMGIWSNLGSVYYDLAVDHAYLGHDALAVQCLDSAFQYQFYYIDGYANDPVFEGLQSREDFQKVVEKSNDWYQFNAKAFSNALSRAKASKELKGLLEK